MKRVLIYSHDTFGLGNIRRMLEVATHLVQASPRVSVLVVTGSPMLHAFRIPARIDYVKLPCLSRDVDGQYAARSLQLSLERTVAMRANLIKSALLDFAPDAVIVDKKPFGVEDELAGAFSALPDTVKRPALVLLLRDILDNADTTSRIWRKNGYFEAIDAWYDKVLVVGSPDVFDLKAEYRFPPLAASKVEYCGYIARKPGRTARIQTRRALGLGDQEPLVLVTPGGGEDGYAMVDTAIKALASVADAVRPRTHIVCGPQMPDAQRRAVLEQAQALAGVSAQEFSDDMMSLMGAADVVLAMGGYNTVCELLSCARRAVLVPRVRPGQEQCIRAERLAAMGLLSMVHPDTLTPQALMGALRFELDALARGAAPVRLKHMNGLDRVSHAVFDLIGLETDAPAVTPAAVPAVRRIAPTLKRPAAAARPGTMQVWA